MQISHSPIHLPSQLPIPALRVTVVTETFAPEVNGVAMTLGKLVDGLLQRGHTVQVVRPRQADENALLSRDHLTHVLAHGIPVPTYRELRFGLPMKTRLMKLWQLNRPDVVHVATEGPLGRSALGAAEALNLPVSSSFHTNFQTYSQHYGLGCLQTLIENYLRRFHNRTLTTMVPTQAMLHDLQARGFQNLAVLSRGVETSQFSPARRSQTLRNSWRAGSGDLVCLHVGRLAKEKNIGAVIEAYRSIQAHQPSAKLVFVGDGPLRKTLETANPDIIFSGALKGDALAQHYASGDMFLFPSLTETFGNVVPEALASGLAVVAFANGAALELIRTEHNGVLVPPGSSADFVNVAVALANSFERRQCMQNNSAASVTHLGWNAIYDSFANALSAVVHRHGQGCVPLAAVFASLPINRPSA